MSRIQQHEFTHRFTHKFTLRNRSIIRIANVTHDDSFVDSRRD